jgi:hypothetical protein
MICEFCRDVIKDKAFSIFKTLGVEMLGAEAHNILVVSAPANNMSRQEIANELTSDSTQHPEMDYIK